MSMSSEVLGKLIADRLVAEGLLTMDRAEAMLPSLIDGTVKPEDWRLAVEMSDQDEGRDDG